MVADLPGLFVRQRRPSLQGHRERFAQRLLSLISFTSPITFASEGFPSWSFYVGMGQDLLPSRLLDLAARELAAERTDRSRARLSTFGEAPDCGVVVLSISPVTRAGLACLAPGLAVACVLGIHVHGQLLVYARRRGGLFRGAICSRPRKPCKRGSWAVLDPGRRPGWHVRLLPSLSLRTVPGALRPRASLCAVWMATAGHFPQLLSAWPASAVLGVGLGAVITLPQSLCSPKQPARFRDNFLCRDLDAHFRSLVSSRPSITSPPP